jgi:hypothetical protein
MAASSGMAGRSLAATAAAGFAAGWVACAAWLTGAVAEGVAVTT